MKRETVTVRIPARTVVLQVFRCSQCRRKFREGHGVPNVVPRTGRPRVVHLCSLCFPWDE